MDVLNLLSLPKFTLTSGTYLHFSGLVNYTYCVLSASRQYTSHSHRMLEEEELTTPAHSFHRWEHWSYQRLCKTCKVTDFENTSVMFVCTVMLFHGLGSACLMCSISDSLPCPGQPWSPSTSPIPSTYPQHLQNPPVWLQHEGSRVEEKTGLQQTK